MCKSFVDFAFNTITGAIVLVVYTSPVSLMILFGPAGWKAKVLLSLKILMVILVLVFLWMLGDIIRHGANPGEEG